MTSNPMSSFSQAALSPAIGLPITSIAVNCIAPIRTGTRIGYVSIGSITVGGSLTGGAGQYSGRVFSAKVHMVPDASRQAKGIPIVNMPGVQVEAGEVPMATITLPEFAPGSYLVMATRRGIIKKTPLEQFERVRSTGIRAITLVESDELAWVDVSSGEDDVIIATAQGMLARFAENEVRAMGRDAGGVIGIRMDKAFVDAGVSSQPEFAWFDMERGWDIENKGVAPDIEVDYRPEDWIAGRDPQLDRGIDELMKKIEKEPVKRPTPPPFPNRAPKNNAPNGNGNARNGNAANGNAQPAAATR